MTLANLFREIPPALPEEWAQTLLARAGVKIERIVSKGHCSPPGFWYDQDQGEWVLLVQGEARVAFEHHSVLLRAGDYLDIPPRQRHRVEWTTAEVETIWLAVFYPADGTPPPAPTA